MDFFIVTWICQICYMDLFKLLNDIPTLKPTLSIRQACREAEAEAYYKSVPMLPPLLGIFPPIHPPIEACPRLAQPSLSCRHHHRYLLHRRITNFKGGHWSRKKISKELLLLIFSHFCCHLKQIDSSPNWSRDLTIAPKQ